MLLIVLAIAMIAALISGFTELGILLSALAVISLIHSMWDDKSVRILTGVLVVCGILMITMIGIQ